MVSRPRISPAISAKRCHDGRYLLNTAPALVDGHVHLHACHDIEAALDAAVRNLELARTALGLPVEAARFLWLVEDPTEGSSARLDALSHNSEQWKATIVDSVTLRLSRTKDGEQLIVVLGRQIPTSDNLEVLVVGTAESLRVGRSQDETIEEGLEREALVMLPWGFGKWTGQRGRAVSSAYDRYASEGLFLADTGARSSFLKPPRVFARSAADAHPVLVGSDPFPFKDQTGALGTNGFVVENLRKQPTWRDLHGAIRSLHSQPRRFGHPLRPDVFARLQLRMQLRKRLVRRAS